MGSILIKNQQASPENMNSEKREYKKMMELGNDMLLELPEGKSESLTVLSYNVLADCYTYFLGFVSNFKSCEKKFLNFNYRAHLVVKIY
jgi:hypothetical protein